jgi:hypothetical protein
MGQHSEWLGTFCYGFSIWTDQAGWGYEFDNVAKMEICSEFCNILIVCNFFTLIVKLLCYCYGNYYALFFGVIVIKYLFWRYSLFLSNAQS